MLVEIHKLHTLPTEYHKQIEPLSVKIKNYVTYVRVFAHEEEEAGMHEVNIVAVVFSKLPTVLLLKWTGYSYTLIKEGTKHKLDILADFLHEEAVKVSTILLLLSRCDHIINVGTFSAK